MTGVFPVLVALLLAPAAAVGEPADIVSDEQHDADLPTLEPVPQATPANQSESRGAAKAEPETAMLNLQPAPVRLFAALKGGASDEELEKLVSETVRELVSDCVRVKEYQVYRSTDQSRTLKVKCLERPLYAVTIGASGEAFVSGGDGTIGQMRLSDGPIKAMLGVRVEEYIETAKAEDKAEADALAAERAAAEGHPARRLLARGAVAAGIVFLLWLSWMGLKEARRHRRSLSRWRGLDSEMKDQLVDESEEIYPDLYRHPEGVFIARGRRGKRRLFSSLVFAYLYCRRGIKLFEIR